MSILHIQIEIIIVNVEIKGDILCKGSIAQSLAQVDA